ncbi:MAG: alpha-xylosidase, partial [Anaerolineae bacterium]
PVMRAMLIEFPDDPGCDTLERQYMLGGSLLVAPVLAADGTVDYYLPHGRWTHLLSGEQIEGGRWVREQHGYLSLPLLARPGSIVPLGAVDDRPDYDYAKDIIFHVFQLQEGTATVRVPTMNGDTALTLEAGRQGDEIQLQATGDTRAWSVLLRGIDAVASVEGGTAQPDPLGTRLMPAAGSRSMTIHL